MASSSWWRRAWSTAAAWSLSRGPAARWHSRIRVTSAARLRDFVGRHSAHEIERRAVDELRSRHPELSAGVSRPRRKVALAYLALAALTAFRRARRGTGCGRAFPRRRVPRLDRAAAVRPVQRALHAPAAAHVLRWLAADLLDRHCALSRSGGGRELVAALRRSTTRRKSSTSSSCSSPTTTRRREARRAAAARAAVRGHARAERGPRTKPKALNAALPFARGSFVAVFDAEDRPEPDQLRLALDAFVAPTTSSSPACRRGSPSTTPPTTGSTRRVHRRICRPVRRVPARPRRMAAAVAARRLVEPFPHRGAARDRRLGSVQRHRGRRSRHAARALRLSHRGHSVDHLRGGAGAASAPGCASARAGSRAGCRPGWCTCARRVGCSRELGLAWLRGVPASGRRHRAGGAGAFAVCRAADLDAGDSRPTTT